MVIGPNHDPESFKELIDRISKELAKQKSNEYNALKLPLKLKTKKQGQFLGVNQGHKNSQSLS